MDNFKVIYKVLKYLDRNKGDEECDYREISPEVLHVAETQWEQILISMQEDGYIKGLVYSQKMDEKFPHLAYPVTPRITLKGMEYLAENKLMKKAANLVKGVAEVVT